MKQTFKKLPEKKQEAILNQAAGVFATRGYYQASIADICQACEISNGALYKYFKNKEDLFSAVLERGISLVSSLYSSIDYPGGSMLEVFRTILHAIRVMVKKHKAYLSIYLDLGTVSMNYFASFVSHTVEDIGRQNIENLLKQGIENGEIDKGISLWEAVYSIDNLLILYAYSLLSEHYKKRLNSFIRTSGGRISDREKVDFIVASIKQIIT